MNKSKYFEREIALIKNEDYQGFIKQYLDEYVPHTFGKQVLHQAVNITPNFRKARADL